MKQPTYTMEEMLERIKLADDEHCLRALLLLFEDEKDRYHNEQVMLLYTNLQGKIQMLYAEGKLKY
jgi:hypothetical protein